MGMHQEQHLTKYVATLSSFYLEYTSYVRQSPSFLRQFRTLEKKSRIEQQKKSRTKWPKKVALSRKKSQQVAKKSHFVSIRPPTFVAIEQFLPSLPMWPLLLMSPPPPPSSSSETQRANLRGHLRDPTNIASVRFIDGNCPNLQGRC